MLKVSIFEYFTRLFPEALIFVFAAYSFNKIKIEKKRYFLSAWLLSLCVFFIRLLPIVYGVHTILNIVILTALLVVINKFEVIKAIKSSIITTMLLFIFEGINLSVLTLAFGSRLEEIIENYALRVIYLMPSLIALFILIVIFYGYLKKRGKLTSV